MIFIEQIYTRLLGDRVVLWAVSRLRQTYRAKSCITPLSLWAASFCFALLALVLGGSVHHRVDARFKLLVRVVFIWFAHEYVRFFVAVFFLLLSKACSRGGHSYYSAIAHRRTDVLAPQKMLSV